MKQIEYVDVVGLGALGTMYADIFTSKLGKDKVRVLADEKRYERYRQEGASFNGKTCDFQYCDAAKEDRPSQVLLFCVKYGGLEDAMKQVAHLVDEDTILISVLNGIRSEEDLSRVFGAEKVIGCTAQKMDATKEGNSVRCTSIGELALGLLDGGVQENLDAVISLFDRIGFPYTLPEDMKRALWSKLVCNVGVNQTVALYEGTYRCVHEQGEAREMMRQAMRECVAVAQAEGISLSEDDVELWTNIIDHLGADGEPSMRQDAKAGRRTEVNLFAGTICELGRKHGIATPVNDRFLNHFTYTYRQVRPGEGVFAAQIEAVSFPANEACPLAMMEKRVDNAPDLFYVALDEAGKMVGFITAIATMEEKLRDEFFTDISHHDPKGIHVMILSLAVLPEYRGKGIARGLMKALLESQKGQGRENAVLTCVPRNIGLYEKLGYTDGGESASEWGDELWHEMTYQF